MSEYKSEYVKLLEADLEFWKRMAKEQHAINNKLAHQIRRQDMAIKEYEATRRFLNESGDDPLAYPEIGGEKSERTRI